MSIQFTTEVQISDSLNRIGFYLPDLTSNNLNFILDSNVVEWVQIVNF